MESEVGKAGASLDFECECLPGINVVIALLPYMDLLLLDEDFMR